MAAQGIDDLVDCAKAFHGWHNFTLREPCQGPYRELFNTQQIVVPNSPICHSLGMNDLETDPTSNEAVAGRLQLTRAALNLRPGEFARDANIKKSTYSNYESGERKPRLDHAILLCDRYDLTLDWIYRGDPSGLRYQLADRIKALRLASNTLSRK